MIDRSRTEVPVRGRWGMLTVLCASLLLVAMDATVLNVALPSLIADLQPGAVAQLWIVDIYGLVLGGLLITFGAIGDRIGRKRLFLFGFALFGLASVVAATSRVTGQLIGGRVLLAIGGAMVMPSTLSLIRNIFHDPHERTRAIAIWAAIAGVGAAVGPIVGGLLVEHFGWAAAFWINVPVVLLTLAAGLWLLPEYRAPSTTPFDWVSVPLSVLGIIGFVWGVKHLARGEEVVLNVLVLLAGLALLIWFARRQLRLIDPLLDIRLFRRPVFLAAALATLIAMIAIGAALFLISLWLQYIHGYSPAGAGLRTAPAAVATLVGSLITPALLRRTGVRTVMVGSLVVLAAGFAGLAISPEPTSYAVIALVLVCLGIGDGIAVTTAAAVLVSSVPPERAGQGGAVEETSYELGNGLGVALLGSVHGALFTRHMADVPLTGAQAATARESAGGAIAVAGEIGGDLGDRVHEIAAAAFDSALTVTSYAAAGVVLVVAILTAILIPRHTTATARH
ncbi:MFS transporter [Nocardia spumae]|uniref:MFS transporter n=1 Tax=Nocardia spumae TaxID=2887190 RepID=UPI001D15DF7A|nr:MFS transporter [Nocardia spumae]